MSILGPVVRSIPVNENSDSAETDISTNNHISEENPLGDDSFISSSWWPN
jgi:hypothetical protein